MIGAPKTLAEARTIIYGRWGGNPRGHRYSEGRCAYHVFPQFGTHYQCLRRAVAGPEKLYCKQHAGIIERL